MAREGRQYYEDERQYREGDYDYREREQGQRDPEPDWEARDRLVRYFSRHGEEREVPGRERERPNREEEYGQQMLGRGYRPDWGREDFERAQREQSARAYKPEERYRSAEGPPRGYLPERAREEHGRRFRPDYDWEREDFERAKREERYGEEYGPERRHGEGPEREGFYQPQGERQGERAPRSRRAEDWESRGPHAGRGPKGYRRPDETIYEEVCERLMQHGQIDASNIEVEVHDGVVVLRGSVDSRQTKYWAEDLSESVFGVKDVQNELRIDQSMRMTSRPRSEGRPEWADRISRGMEVLDKNGNSVGQVKDIRDNDLLLDRRMQRDIFVPFHAIERVDDVITLNVDEARMDDLGWQKPEWMQPGGYR